MKDEIEVFITNALITKYDISEEDFTVDTSFKSLDLDSLALVELTVALEVKFGITVPDGLLGGTQSIREAALVVADAVDNKVAS